jgi:hypothetical protein
MKAILEFELPDDQFEHLVAVKAMDMYALMSDTLEHIRQMIKHDQNISGEQAVALDNVREFILDEMKSRDLMFINW